MADSLPILVPLDDTEDLRAVELATQLAADIGSGVRVLSVVSDSAHFAAQKADLEKALSTGGSVQTDVRVIVHDSVERAIVDDAESASVVCMTTAATLLPHEGHFGSIAELVVRALERPVMLLGPKATGALKNGVSRLVVPVDGSVAGEYIIKGAANLAKLMGLEVWVVTVVSAAQERRVEAVAGPEYGALESGYVRRIARAIGKKSGLDAQFEVLHGSHPAEAILAFADPDAIVAMSTHGRSGLSRIFAGSVTTEVVAGSHHPVMVVRPPDKALPVP